MHTDASQSAAPHPPHLLWLGTEFCVWTATDECTRWLFKGIKFINKHLKMFTNGSSTCFGSIGWTCRNVPARTSCRPSLLSCWEYKIRIFGQIKSQFFGDLELTNGATLSQSSAVLTVNFAPTMAKVRSKVGRGQDGWPLRTLFIQFILLMEHSTKQRFVRIFQLLN